MKKIFVLMMMALASAAFAKECCWDSTMHWPNNDPEVVKTMPLVQNFMKSCFEIDIKDVEFVDINENDQKTVDNVIRFAEKTYATVPKVGSFIYYNDVKNVLVIVFLDVSEITEENICICHFAKKIGE